ncbi:helix-turn-helix domain-containing protein [Dokdonella sp.]|uniref:helix-turn-helix domain-containing protein n=1 Tax=Dokdonella sp. TaxID=2291710 RepID=UPI0031BC93CE|nr:helix-turn-helix domain-containing protein [Dokdonella sp.]
MTKMTAKQRITWEKGRDLNAELHEAIADAKHGRWARKTEFRPLADGRMRRMVTRRDGTVEKDEVIPAAHASVVAARAGTGLSQSEFASIMGVSVRTLQDWEAGRRRPSGAAQTLLRIAARHPRVVREAAI